MIASRAQREAEASRRRSKSRRSEDRLAKWCERPGRFGVAETTEIPEVDDPFGRKVALTIAILAVCLSIIQNRSDDARTESILKTTEAANQWGYYQSKSLKEALYEQEARMLELLQPGPDPAARKETIAHARAEEARYEGEKEKIREEANRLTADAARYWRINDRCDLGALGLQVGIVICSVAILGKWRRFWAIGIGLGVVGVLLGISAFLI
jgi:Domain of unknown function (DUF4337)